MRASASECAWRAAPRAAPAQRAPLRRCGRRAAQRTAHAPSAAAPPASPAPPAPALQRAGGAEPHGWNRGEWARGYATQPLEFAYEVADIEGALPPELEGTYFRNGPGTFEAGPDRYAHPFDGDGYVASLALVGGRAWVRTAYVATPERAAERAAGRVLHRNTFGTQRAGGAAANFGDVAQKNVANTAVLFWAGRLLALWEALQPYRMNPATLATVGVDTLDDLLREGLPFASGAAPLDAALRAARTGLGGDALSAHPHVCGATGNLVTFAYQIRPHADAPPRGPLRTVLRVMEFRPGSLTPCAERDVPLQGYGFVHDFCFTEHYYVIFQNPVDLDIVPFVAGARCPGQCLTFRPDRPTLAFIVPRGRPGPIRTAALPLPAVFVFHHANAHEDAATGDVVVDSVHMAGLELGISPGSDFRDADFEASPPYTLWRTRIPVAQGSSSSGGAGADAVIAASSAPLSGRIVEFPCVAPARFGRAARWVYSGVGLHPTRVQPLQGWVKFDVSDAALAAAPPGEAPHAVWAPGAHFFAGEPQFVARPGGTDEDDGWLVGWVFDGAAGVSGFAVVDARSMRQLALLRLRHHIPYGLHGTFVPQLFDANALAAAGA